MHWRYCSLALSHQHIVKLFIVPFLAERQKQLDGAVVEGQKFNTSLSSMLNWLSEKGDAIEAIGPISGNTDLLCEQNRDAEVGDETARSDQSLKFRFDRNLVLLKFHG